MRAPVERHHERAAGRVGDGAVLRQMNAGGRAQAQRAASFQRNLHRLALRGNRAAIAQQRLAMIHVDGPGDLNLGGGSAGDRFLGLLSRMLAGCCAIQTLPAGTGLR